MKFFLNHQPKKLPFHISHDSKLFFIGSCFSEHIHSYAQQSGIHSYSNPFGNLFNPFSCCKTLDAILQNQPIDSSNFVERDSNWYSLNAHSKINATSASDLQTILTNTQLEANRQLKSSNVLFITLGSAWYYHHIGLNKAVANCQKLPQQNFQKKLAELDEICSAFSNTIALLKKNIPQLQIVFTVSPVRHLRDGIEENFISKSILRIAIESICKTSSQCYYFSAYELINDDLKDYRFYEPDLAHPNKLAISYVEEKFADTFFDAATTELAHLYQRKHALLQHQLLNATENSALQHKAAVKKIQDLIDQKRNEYAKN